MSRIFYMENWPRACLNCGIVLTFADFFHEGCPNCDVFIRLKNNLAKVVFCTSSIYFNLCLLPGGCNHWGTSMVPVDTFTFGTYAFFVFGRIPRTILREVLFNIGDSDSDSD